MVSSWYGSFRRWFLRAPIPKLLALGFAAVILIGAFILWLPVSQRPGQSISFYEALFESTSAICVTGLTVVSPGGTFSLFGRIILAILIQIGGMGIVLLGIFLIMIARGRLGFKTRSLFVQAQNLAGYSDILHTAKVILRIMFGIEAIGAVLLTFALMRYFDPLRAFGHGCFLAVSAFNNAGFDVFYGGNSLIPFAADVPINLIITVLVIIGGFGFIAMMDLFRNHFHWHKLLLTTKVALFMTLFLLISGTLLLKWTSEMTWLECWFQSVIARTAGFATYPLLRFSQPALLIFIILMFIGASPNSTGGGIKTTTVFVCALKAFSSTMQHDENSVFHRRIPEIIFSKAYTVLFFGLAVVLVGTCLICAFEPGIPMSHVLAEVTSAFGTVGSSCNLTGSLGNASRGVLIACMYIGRLGPVTIANLLVTSNERQARYTDETVLIG